MAAEGSIVIVAEIDDKKAQAELNRLAKKIDGLQDKIQHDKGAQLPFIEQANELGAKLDVARAKLEELRNLPAYQADDDKLDFWQNRVKMLEVQYNAADSKVQQYDRSIQRANDSMAQAEERAGKIAAELSKVDSTGAQAATQTSELAGNLTQASNAVKATGTDAEQVSESLKDAGRAGEEAGKRTSEGFNLADTAVGKLERRIIGLAKRVFFFSLITKALRGLRTWVGNTIKTNDEASAAIGRLKGALLTLAQPIMSVVIPAFVSFINVLSKVISAVAAFVARLFGTTVSEATASAEALYDEQAALKGVGSAAKKTEHQLASFDEINKLTEDDAGGSAGGLNDAIKPLFDEIANYKLPEMPDWLKDLATSLKLTVEDVIFDWSDLNGEQIAEKVIAGLGLIAGAVTGFALGGVPGAIRGALAGVAIALLINALTFDHDGKIGKEELLKLIVLGISGLIGGALGIAITHSAKGAAIGFSIGALIGLVINQLTFDNNGRVSRSEVTSLLRTALLGLFGGIVGLAIGGPIGGFIGLSVGVGISLVISAIEYERKEALKNKFDETALGKELVALEADIESRQQIVLDLIARINSITAEPAPDLVADLSLAEQLINDIFDMDANENKTAAELALIKEKIDLLNSLSLPGVFLEFDDATQRVLGTKQALLDTTAALLEQYRVEARREAYIEAYRLQAEAAQELVTAEGQLQAAGKVTEQAYNDLEAATHELNRENTNFLAYLDTAPAYEDALWRALGIATGGVKEHRDAIAAAQDKVDMLTDAYDRAFGTYEEASSRVEALKDAYNIAGERVLYFEQAITDSVSAANDAKTGLKPIEDRLSGISANAQAAKTDLEKFAYAMDTVSDKKSVLDNALAGAMQDMNNLSQTISNTAKTTKTDGQNALSGYASGLTAGTPTAERAMESAAKSVHNKLTAFNDSHSPSKLYAQDGKNTMTGLAGGVREGTPLAETAMESAAKSLIRRLATGITDNSYLVRNAMTELCNTIADIAEKSLNGIVDKTNDITTKVNTTSPKANIPKIPKVRVPRLAQGAVIPPNREFLAVLGDQSSGRNIEAPESALRAMAAEAAGANTSLLRDILAAIREGRVIMVDRLALGKTSQGAILDAQRMGY